MNEEPEQSTALAVREDGFSGVPAGSVQRAVFLPTNLEQAMKLAEFMSGGIGVRPWMRGNPSACLMVLQQAMRWGMDPYAVAQKCYYTNETLCFEAQLVNAVINTSGELIGRLKIEFAGEWAGMAVQRETLVCRVSGKVRADPEQVFVLEQPLCDVKIRNSPLWKVNPQLQLAYHTTRSWARLYMPEVLLGVYTPDEIEDGAAADMERRTTPAAALAPDRRDFAGSGAEPAVDAEIEEVDDQSGGNQVDSTDLDAGIPADGAESADQGEENATEEPIPGAEDASGEAETAGAEPVAEAAGDQPGDVDQEPLPVEPLEWSVWERETKEAILACADVDALNTLRQAKTAAMDAADEELQHRMDDAFADRLADLVG